MYQYKIAQIHQDLDKERDFIPSIAREPRMVKKNSHNEQNSQNNSARNPPVPSWEYFCRLHPFVSAQSCSPPGKINKICWNMSLSSQIDQLTACGKSMGIDFMVFYIAPSPCCSHSPQAVADNKWLINLIPTVFPSHYFVSQEVW